MNYFVFLLSVFLIFGLPAASFAQMSDAERRLMENMAADEDSWTGEGAEEELGEEELPEFMDEQNPQEDLRRSKVPQEGKPAAPETGRR